MAPLPMTRFAVVAVCTQCGMWKPATDRRGTCRARSPTRAGKRGTSRVSRDEADQAGVAPPAGLPPECARPTGVDQCRHHVALDPAGALGGSRPSTRSRLLPTSSTRVMPTLIPCADARMPRSASLGHVVGIPRAELSQRLHPEWFDVPPRGIGSLHASRPGSMVSNHIEYSSVNMRVRMFSRALK